MKATTFKEKIFYLIILLWILTSITSKMWAQTVVKDSSGYYTMQNARTTKEAPKPTGRNFKTAEGQILPIYQGSSGAYYVVRTSKKSGKEYKQYLKFN